MLLIADSATQEPLAEVVVTDLITRNSVRSSKDGAVGLFIPDFVKAEGAVLRFTKIGYDEIGPIEMDPTISTMVVIRMQRSTARLPAMMSTSRYRIELDSGRWNGFELRCSVHSVSCTRESELSAHPAANLLYFLNRTIGIVPQCVTQAAELALESHPKPRQRIADCIKMHGSGLLAGGLCIPTYYVDGARMGAAEGTLDQIEHFFVPNEVKGIEVYLSGEPMPLRLGEAPGNEGCGVVAIWTK